ncbi:DNA-binding protein P3A2-like [Corticium candelabrum]|uniref:DNA-binding protein P3A2-like n=1 Tax=Corticium candelabrum TaxID=121492 RepID=UPI002E25591C|nr:DNA-binding protein P3A2-like [Corticium candelabrum]
MASTADPTTQASTGVDVIGEAVDSGVTFESIEQAHSHHAHHTHHSHDSMLHTKAEDGDIGPMGLAYTAADGGRAHDCLGLKRKRSMSFEANPAIRKRQAARLLKKLKTTVDEYTTRVGQQAVVVTCATKSASGSSTFKVFGAAPLEGIVREHKETIMKELNVAAQNQLLPQPSHGDKFDLPALVVEGNPVPLDKMTQAQLRAFIPDMLKASLQRGKPGWGKEEMKPAWWPDTVPWQNVRSDVRSEQQKEQQSWTDALRSIVRSCYQYHNRLDLVTCDKSEVEMEAEKELRHSRHLGEVVLHHLQPDGTMILQHTLEQTDTLPATVSMQAIPQSEISTLAEVAVSQEGIVTSEASNSAISALAAAVSGSGTLSSTQFTAVLQQGEAGSVATLISQDPASGTQLINIPISQEMLQSALASEHVMIPTANHQVEVASVTHGDETGQININVEQVATAQVMNQVVIEQQVNEQPTGNPTSEQVEVEVDIMSHEQH